MLGRYSFCFVLFFSSDLLEKTEKGKRLAKREKRGENLKWRKNVPLDQACISCEELLLCLVSVDYKKKSMIFGWNLRQKLKKKMLLWIRCQNTVLNHVNLNLPEFVSRYLTYS